MEGDPKPESEGQGTEAEKIREEILKRINDPRFTAYDYQRIWGTLHEILTEKDNDARRRQRFQQEKG